METTEMLEQAKETATSAILATVLATVRAAIRDKALTWVSMLGAIGFTGWALHDPTPERLAGVAGYAVLVFWPVLYKQR